MNGVYLSLVLLPYPAGQTVAPVKALCTERLTEWYPKFTKLGLLCIEATGDTDVDFSQLQPYNNAFVPICNNLLSLETTQSSAQSVHRIEKLQNQLQGSAVTHKAAPSIRFVAVSATVSNPEDVANWLGTSNKSAVFHRSTVSAQYFRWWDALGDHSSTLTRPRSS
ncbi:unnamed protein product [Arctia plantaginis]|uniref:Uncharacterized protein n=1 Tax=Arctia plantaginis TaxID=874455 RepID=A0A8S1BNJ1_ARCPL|nr:unnamed protein product [Arctia plantaginis]